MSTALPSELSRFLASLREHGCPETRTEATLAETAESVLKHLHQTSQECMPPMELLDKGILSGARQEVLVWLQEAFRVMRLPDNLLFDVQLLLDRYYASSSCKSSQSARENVLAAVLLALKNASAMSPRELVIHLGRDQVAFDDVVRAERAMLQKLGFRIGTPTAQEFLGGLSVRLRTNVDPVLALGLADFLLQLTLVDASLHYRHPHAILAAAALDLGLQVTRAPASAHVTLMEDLAVHFPDNIAPMGILLHCRTALHDMWVRAASFPDANTYSRHLLDKFSHVCDRTLLSIIQTPPIHGLFNPHIYSAAVEQVMKSDASITGCAATRLCPNSHHKERVSVGSVVCFGGNDEVRIDLGIVPGELATVVSDNGDGSFEVCFFRSGNVANVSGGNLHIISRQRLTSCPPPSPTTLTALSNYELFYELPFGSATVEQVSRSSAGVAGWADTKLDREAPVRAGLHAVCLNPYDIFNGNRVVTRMGESESDLKAMLEGMVRHWFENYLIVSGVVQNEIGKLAALECQLRVQGDQGRVGISISCNEDGTFLVYAEQPSSQQGSASANAADEVATAEIESTVLVESGRLLDAEHLIKGVWISDLGDCSVYKDSASGRLAYEEFFDSYKLFGWLVPNVDREASWEASVLIIRSSSDLETSEDVEVAGDIQLRLLPEGLQTRIQVRGEDHEWQPAVKFHRCEQDSTAKRRERCIYFLRSWVEQVREFGMSGRCYSLIRLFQFGYNAWKPTFGGSREPDGGIAAEEERHREDDHPTPPVSLAVQSRDSCGGCGVESTLVQRVEARVADGQHEPRLNGDGDEDGLGADSMEARTSDVGEDTCAKDTVSDVSEIPEAQENGTGDEAEEELEGLEIYGSKELDEDTFWRKLVNPLDNKNESMLLEVTVATVQRVETMMKESVESTITDEWDSWLIVEQSKARVLPSAFDAESLSAALVVAGPLWLGTEATEDTSARGDVTHELAALVRSFRGRQAYRIGRMVLPVSGDALIDVPACAKVLMKNDGSASWPGTTTIALVAGEAFGLSRMAVAPIMPNETTEIEMGFHVPLRSAPGKASSTWAVIDAATDRQFGLLLVLEIVWTSTSDAVLRIKSGATLHARWKGDPKSYRLGQAVGQKFSARSLAFYPTPSALIFPIAEI